MKIETTISLERDDEAEIVLTVKGNYTPGHPGRTYGPPENCSPPEPAEVEVEEILGPDGKPFVFASDEEETKIQEQAEEALYQVEIEDDRPDWEPDDD